MDNLPYELLFSIALHLDSPKDLCSFSRVSSLFLSVARDDRLWKRLCYYFYAIKSSNEEIKQSFYHLFTKILVPYGRYLGYWKSNQVYVGGLIHVHLDLTNGMFIGEKIQAINTASLGGTAADDDEDEEEEEEENELESFLKPVYNRTKLFTINSQTSEIFCYECQMLHKDLPWKKTFHFNENYFGLAQECLPVDKRSSLINHNHQFDEPIDDFDIFFLIHCLHQLPILYHPLTIPQPSKSETSHLLSRFNGLWVGTYGGHGLELLCLEYHSEFLCPGTIDGRQKQTQLVHNVLIARKVTGDRNVPHGQISFAAIHPIESNSDGPICYEGIGQIAETFYHDPQFIRTKIDPLSENLLKVTWYALYHSSLFKRCLF